MHIPDGYLSPSTCAAAAAAAVPSWMLAARRLRRKLGDREAPLLAAGAAFCFVLMMLNVPVPGGTTAHAVGGTLVAIVLGPEAAVLAVTVTLIIQALFFGDGGVLTLGVNCLNMAIILPVSGWIVYRGLCPGAGSGGRGLPRPWAAGCGAYVGINLAALSAALELGIQPLLFHTPGGAPLYCPYRLSQTIPAMAIAHLTVAGGVESAVTGLAVAYLLSADPRSVLDLAEQPGRLTTAARRATALLLVIAPLGLIAHASAFGEWSTGELRAAVGLVPPGLARLHGLWSRAPLPGYTLPAAPAGINPVIGYWLSAAIGVVCVILFAGGLRFLLRLRRPEISAVSVRTRRRRGSAAPPREPGPRWSEGGLPGWLEQNRRPATRLALSGRRRGVSFVEKTLSDLAASVQQTIFAEEISRARGLLQSLHPGVKLATIAAVIVMTASLRRPAVLLAVVILSASLAALSSAPISLLVRRFGAVTAWTAVIAMPSILNVVTPGSPLIVLARLPAVDGIPLLLTVTQEGCQGALVLLLRVTACVWLAALLTLSTRWDELLAAMRGLGAPRLFVFVLAMVYRYLFLLLRIAGDLFTARRSRMVTRESVDGGREFVAAAASFLFGKSRALSEETYAAMVSRGYRGEPRALASPPPGVWDLAWCGACGAVLFALWWGDRLRG